MLQHIAWTFISNVLKQSQGSFRKDDQYHFNNSLFSSDLWILICYHLCNSFSDPTPQLLHPLSLSTHISLSCYPIPAAFHASISPSLLPLRCPHNDVNKVSRMHYPDSHGSWPEHCSVSGSPLFTGGNHSLSLITLHQRYLSTHLHTGHANTQTLICYVFAWLSCEHKVKLEVGKTEDCREMLDSEAYFY